MPALSQERLVVFHELRRGKQDREKEKDCGSARKLLRSSVLARFPLRTAFLVSCLTPSGKSLLQKVVLVSRRVIIKFGEYLVP